MAPSPLVASAAIPQGVALGASSGDSHADSGDGSERVVVTLSGEHDTSSMKTLLHVLCGDASINPSSTSSHAELESLSQLVIQCRFIASARLHAPGASSVIKDILFRAHSANLSASFRVPSSTDTADSLEDPQTQAHTVTVYTRGHLPPRVVSSIAKAAHVTGAHRRSPPDAAHTCYEIDVFVQESQLPDLRRALWDIGREVPCTDVAVQRRDARRVAARMAIFDLSWTLVQCDAIDAVLSAAGRAPDEKDVQARERGELEDAEWRKIRVLALKGAQARSAYGKAREQLIYTQGAHELCRALRRLGCRIAVVSSGASVIAEAARTELGLDYAFGNELEVDTHGMFTGRIVEPVVDAERKAELVQMLAMTERIGTEQMIVVADGPVSDGMLQLVGLPIAFDQPGATEEVRAGRIASKSLASVMYLLGFSGDDLGEATASIRRGA